MKRQPTSYAHVQLPEACFEDVVRLAIAWTLGLPPFLKYRTNRRRSGVPDTLTVDVVRSEVSVETDHLLLRAYGDGELWAVRFRHPQRNRPEIVWETVVLIDRSEGGTEFIQLTTRTSRRGSYTASRTALVTELVERFGSTLQDQLLVGEPDVLWHPGAVHAYVRSVLLDEARRLPVVVVTRRHGAGPTAVDAKALARCMAGSALVVELVSAKVSYAWSNALEGMDLDPKLGCYNGAIRQYLPKLGLNPDPRRHRLFLFDRLMALPEAHRLETVAGAFLLDFVGPQIPDILEDVGALWDGEE